MEPGRADVAHFLVKLGWKISRQKLVADGGHVQGLQLDPLYGQAGLSRLRRHARLMSLWNRFPKAKGHETDRVADGGLVIHIAAAEVDLGFEHRWFAGRCVEHGRQLHQLWIGADVANVDSKGQRLVGLVSVDREPDLVEAGRAAVGHFEKAGGKS